MVQRNVVSMQKEGTRAAHISNHVYDVKKSTFVGPNASSQLRDKYADADVPYGEQGRVHTFANTFVYKSNDLPVDAWVYMAHSRNTKDDNMYIPMLLTVEAGLESFGANVRVIDRFDAEDMVEQVRKRVADTGKVPLVLGVAFEPRYSEGEGEKILRKCAKAGAYVVLYNTEPTQRKIDNVASAAKRLGAQEVWDYNMLNVHAYKPDGAFIVRYVPPGYLTKVAPEASHVNLENPSRNESSIGFMGKFRYRPQETQDVILRQFGERFQESCSIWTWDDYVHWMDKYPMQLNVHRTEEDIGLEAFRLSMLLTFKACVISAPSDPADMEEWKGIVHFADTKDMMKVFSKVTGRDTGVRDCQLSSSSEFQKRFHPKVIIQKSGLMNDWHPGQAAKKVGDGTADADAPGER